MRTLKGGRKSQAGEHSIGVIPRRKPVLDNTPDPYQKRVFYAGQPDSTLYDSVRGGFQKKNLLGKA